MYIKRAKLKNFQAHTDTLIEFGPGINVIVGNTDVGKSSIIRALRWVMRNYPLGDSVWNTAALEEGDPCVVGLALDVDGQEIKVIRRREKTGNFYKLIEDGGKPKEFGGFKNEVPEPIRRYVGEPVVFGKDFSYDLNLSPQLEVPFLISENSRNITRVLGKLTGIDVLDLAEQMAATEIRSLKVEAKTLLDTRERMNSELRSLPDPIPVDELLDQAEIVARVIDRKRERADRIESISGALKRRGAEIDRLEGIERELGSDVALAASTFLGMTGQIQRHTKLLKLTQEHSVTASRIESLKRNLQGLPEIDSSVIASMNGLSTKERDLSARMQALRTVRDSISQTEILLKSTEDEATREKQALDDLLQNTAICPLSKGTFFDECKKRISG
jgi:exonuclease SbcC